MKNIPAALQAHLNQDATTYCFLLLVECVGAFAGTVIGSTTLDESLTYDAGGGTSGLGPIVYGANNSFSMDRLETTGDLSVDNTELHGWVSDSGVTEAQIRAGIFDFARITIFRVNYMDLSQGHEIWGGGFFGRAIYTRNRWDTEYRSLLQLLKEPYSDLYSIKCPVKFGSPQCGKTFSWSTYTISSVDSTEPDRIFSAAGMNESAGFYDLGVVEVLSGDNQGAQMEVRAHGGDSSGGDVTLALGLPVALQVGDSFRIRKDCSKEWDDATNGCLFHWGSDRGLHHRGQPLIPTSDAGASMVPGAQL